MAACVGEKQRVEILRMLYHKSRVLILDEPTAVLTPQETRELFANLRKMADNGCAVVFISHKLNEVEELADRITVLRSGVVSGRMEKSEINRGALIQMMVGRELNTNYPHKPAGNGDVVLKLEKISALGDMHTLALDNVSFEIRCGRNLWHSRRKRQRAARTGGGYCRYAPFHGRQNVLPRAGFYQ